MTGGLPLWAQWVWASISAFTLLGGALWTIFFVYRYMRRMERITLRLLELSIEGRTASEKANVELQDALKHAADGIAALATAQKIGMGVNLVSSLIPTLVAELKGIPRAKSSLD